MADSAAFFANKKKGKKKFKSFNANKVDVSAVSSTVHVDAPPIDPSKEEKTADDGEWDTMQTNSKNVVVTTKTQGVTELLNMVALEERRREDENISDRMDREATRKALAKAKEGMEKQGQKLKEEEEKKKAEQQAKAAKKAPAVPLNTAGGKWVPPHMRSSARPVNASKKLFGSATLNTSDESAFPDLATAAAAPPEEKPPAPQLNTSRPSAPQSNPPSNGKWIPPHMRSR